MTDHQLFEFIFDDKLRPRVSAFPNVVQISSQKFLRYVLHVSGCRGATWNRHPPYLEDGTPFDADLDRISSFKLWDADANQRQIEKEYYCQLGNFNMVIDARTPEELLQWYDLACEENHREIWNYTIFGFHWHLFAPRMKEIRWAYIPLSDEFPLAMFVTHPNYEGWVQAVKQRFMSQGLQFCSVVYENERDTWHLPSHLRKACFKEA